MAKQPNLTIFKLTPLAVGLAVSGISAAYAGSIEFSEVPVPVSDTEKREVVASPQAVVDGKPVAIDYHVMLRTGDKPSKAHSGKNAGIYGQLIDAEGNPVLAEDGSPRISNSTDFSSLLKGRNNRLYMVSHFEDRPGAMYLTELKQTKDGDLIPRRTRPLDFSQLRGGWVHCAGSVTPWGTHLGSEEYPPNALLRDPATGHIDDYYDPMGAYYGGDLLALNPYDYGYAVEVTVKNFNHAKVEKHYAMGRSAIELAYVMPNKKTAYISDDGTNVGLYRFEADRKGDLSAGRLYAAKWNQTSADGVGSADIGWVDLGHADDREIKKYLDDKISFFDIFETDDPADGCAAGFSEINTTDGHECLKVKPHMEKAASRMETRRYAAMLGATTEWRKMEGISYNPEAKQLYIAMSEVSSGMEDNGKYDAGGPNDIKVAKNKCGAVYALDVDHDFVATNMYGLVAGTPVSGDGNNTCALDGLANPDNITYMPGYNTLIIGEDTGDGHQNDAIWSYNLDENKLTRIFTTPYGSETTSPYFYPDINGHAYLMAVVQHPYGESDQDKLENPADMRAYTGFIGPFPAMNGSHHQGGHRNHKR
ncbi:PhoX family protein [Methylomonas sp. MgM2]